MVRNLNNYKQGNTTKIVAPFCFFAPNSLRIYQRYNGAKKFEYAMVPIGSKRLMDVYRHSRPDCTDEESSASSYQYPFGNLPTLESHVQPHWVILNAGMKLDSRSECEIDAFYERVAHAYDISRTVAISFIKDIIDFNAKWRSPTPQEVASPKVALPKVTLPKVTLPKVTLPKVARSKVVLPKAASPEVALSKVASPEVALSKVAPLQVAPPQVTSPEVVLPKVASPEVALSKVASPEVALSKVAPLQVAPPKVALPEGASTAQVVSPEVADVVDVVDDISGEDNDSTSANQPISDLGLRASEVLSLDWS
ncbi:hypothetical protein HETIRDRAFT_447265 [Heterobasidion irregulare TC 32-1]|uniref:Uncharacterized protein n=1 Tax=Heterobasidion irregulare (strain TC 32-1) TaxID=747525 RepID=W4KL49_HETIT|nr:uncharacterized protein HETIRDRAFT_447265 [Heterobasidion irregulare TC 32-1]ETW86552.1 hypothetical protein HETIRDRAFT_447265 [Heterobasidion irregulare TC 32-1]